MFTLSRVSHRNGYFSVSGTKVEVLGYTKYNVFLFRFTWSCVCPSFYGDVPPVSTRIISRFRRVPTSFVPPIHILGAGLAPLQGPALWKIFLPATGSFFGFVVTDLSGLIPFPAPSGGRFPGLFLIPFSFPVTAEFNHHRTSISAQFNCNKNILYLSSSVFYAVCS